ncbi:Penicillin-binding protein 1A [Escherichia coli]|uniref:Penicillin-binding protein 1A n=1 Tax=Escherichia coli TaxID=562 RepID=A0A376Y145_ECOLX|nr:Penicillin-binding protein 1A [Escherichia coli]
MVLGYGPGVVTSVWIGFDDHRRNLGHTTASGAIKDQISGYEGGAKSAQPAWDAYMKAVLEGVPEQPLTPPPGIVTVNIDRSTGQLANGGNSRESISSKVRSRHNRQCTRWERPLSIMARHRNCSD